MNQPPGISDRLSPNPMVCPLARLDHNSSNEGTRVSPAGSSYLSDEFSYHPQYVQQYDNNSRLLNREKSYIPKQATETDYYYQPHSLSEKDILEYNTNYELSNRLHARNSPVDNKRGYSSKDSLDLTSFSNSSYWDHKNFDSQQNGTYFCQSNHHVQEKNHLLDNFTKLGKSSPCLDQGYHTLVAPSPASIAPSIWSETNSKGKKYHPKNNSFDRLSDELVVRIFSFLSSVDLSICAQVCRRFDTLAWTPSLWRVITLDYDSINGDKAIKGVLRQLCGQGRTGACPSVERVYVANGAILSDRSVILLARRCPELTHLQLQGCSDITNNSLFEIATRCHNLQHLDVTGKKNYLRSYKIKISEYITIIIEYIALLLLV